MTPFAAAKNKKQKNKKKIERLCRNENARMKLSFVFKLQVQVYRCLLCCTAQKARNYLNKRPAGFRGDLLRCHDSAF